MGSFWARRNKLERWALGLTAGFVCTVSFAAILLGAGMLEGILAGNRSSGSNACRDARNAKLPFCQEAKFKKDAEWRELNRYNGGKTNAFTLYRNGK